MLRQPSQNFVWHSTEIGSCCFPFGFLIYAGTVVLPVSSRSLRLLHSLPSRAPIDRNEARALEVEKGYEPQIVHTISFVLQPKIHNIPLFVFVQQYSLTIFHLQYFVVQRDAIVGIGVTAQTTAGNPKRHTPRRRAGRPRARTNNIRTEAHAQGPKQPATTRNTQRARKRRKRSNTRGAKRP